MPDAAAPRDTLPPSPALAALGALARRLAGPILGKELRVASRRKRTYALRAAYVLGLAAVAAIVFSFGAGASSRPDTARDFVVVVAWIQFLAGQVMAAVMLGGAVADERRHRTLDVLLATPITGARFVLGKYLSAMLQIALVIALSFPVLGIVRIFGGVPWDYVAASTGITLAATLAAGALALVCAVHAVRHAKVPGLLAIYLLIGWQASLTVGAAYVGAAGGNVPYTVCAAINPFLALFEQTGEIYMPGSRLPAIDWPFRCALMAGLSALLLLLAIRGARSALERRAFPPERRAAPARGSTAPEATEPSHVSARPVYWKDVRPSRRRGRKLTLRIAQVTGIGACAGFVVLFFSKFPFQPVAILLNVVWLFAAIATSVLAARSIAFEKEGRTWALVLATPLSDGRIVGEKALAVLRRTAFLWVILAGGNSILMAAVNFSTSPQTAALLLVSVPLGLACQFFFLLGAGLYFSVRCRTSAAATAFTLGCMPGWCLFRWLIERVAIVVVIRFSGIPTWPYPYILTHYLAGAIVDIALGLLFLRAARRRLRRSVW